METFDSIVWKKSHWALKNYAQARDFLLTVSIFNRQNRLRKFVQPLYQVPTP